MNSTYIRTLGFGTSALIVGAITGWFGIAFITNNYVYHRALTEISKLHGIKMERLSFLQRPSWWFGTVASVDAPRGTLVIQFVDHFVAGGTRTIPLTIAADDTTSFIQQNLIKSDDVYTGLSERVVGTIFDIKPGVRISAIIENSEGDIKARTIIYGDQPL